MEKQLGLFEDEKPLKACPFCGSQNIEMVFMEIICHSCSLDARFMLCSIETHAKRIWNSRHSPDDPKTFSEL